MKNILYISLIALLSFSSIAQGAKKVEDKDPKAKAILEKVNTKYESYKTVAIDFEVKLKGEGINETIKGKAYKSGDKYAYDTEDYKVVCDGKSVWTFVKADNQVTITSVDDTEGEEGEMLNPTKLLTIWKKGFKYKLIGDATIAGRKTKQISLFPENPKKAKFHTITLFVDNAKSEMKRVKVKGRDGVDMEYTIKKFDGKTVVSSSKFKFDASKYPGIEENDMRF